MHLYTVNYVAENKCRRATILGHFGEKYTRGNCGMCDVCVRKANGTTADTVELADDACLLLSSVKAMGVWKASGGYVIVRATVSYLCCLRCS